MVTVMICGAHNDTSLADALLAGCSSLGATAACITQRSVSRVPPDAGSCDFLLLDSVAVRSINIENGIAIFKSNMNCGDATQDADVSGLMLPTGFTAVVEPENEPAIEIIRRSRVQAITCGLSQADTLTFSSIDTGNAVISLQRAIQSLYGGAILPRDIPVSFGSAYSGYQLLATAAIMLLSETPLPDSGLTL